ncbi:polysaccharide deacetylase family protein [Palleniella muris]|uniref:Polysaccharide deacetylase family protein n=1 Tax=Palleniella muris TaxID=3038145 RepID=A0AC61QNC4_9BACT|nr:polysaccharide deacetylase family protein [Palleniella muris]TGX81018.1 polysaccharide deacetylase family protein [Palleniella muris]
MWKAILFLLLVGATGEISAKAKLPATEGGSAQSATVEIAKWRHGCQYAVSLTFDDGLQEHYTEVFPRLREQNLQGTFWLIGSAINNGSFKQWKTVSWEQAKEMADSGMEMSNHGFNHRSVTKLTPEEIVEQARLNDDVIELHTGLRPTTFCFPGNQKTEIADSLLSVGRVGLRTFQTSWGGKRISTTRNDLIGYFKEAVKSNDWFVTMTHGISYGYDNCAEDTAQLWNFFRFLNDNRQLYWTATFHDVAVYGKVRDNTTLLVKRKRGRLHVKCSCPLDEKLYATMLTLIVKTANGGTKLVDVNPFGGEVVI